MADRLKAISSGLLITDMSVQGGIPSCSCEVLAIFKWNVLTIARLVAFSQTEVNDVDGVFCGFSTSSHEIIRLDVSMNNSLFMDYLNSLEHLNCNMKNSGEIKFSSALLEKVLEGFAELVHDHNVVSLAVLSFLIPDEM